MHLCRKNDIIIIITDIIMIFALLFFRLGEELT